MQNWQYKVVKSQRGLNGKWFYYPAAATFAGAAEACQYAADFAAEQRADGVRGPGTRILVLSRRKVEGPVGPTNCVAEYRLDDEELNQLTWWQHYAPPADNEDPADWAEAKAEYLKDLR